MKSNLPVFIIVGAMKSGSTTLHQYLSNHRKISIAGREVHFFNRDQNYQKGHDWYLAQLNEFTTPETLIVGEKTPTYSYLEHIPAMIRKDYPGAKLIWVFRNPIDRAYSNYWHAVAAGVEPLRFDKAVKNEAARVEKNVFHGYLKRSFYHEQVERYLAHFPAEQMHYMLFEDLVKNPEAELKTLFDFLGIPFEGYTHIEQHANKSLYPRWPWSIATAKKLFGAHSGVYKFIRNRNIKAGKKKSISPELRKELVEYFREPNQKLAKLIGKDVSVWNR
jgi:hypothetical protein